ncbi:Cytochrome P450, partial [Sesbania bispinosa]
MMLPQALAIPSLLLLIFILILSAALFHPKQHQHDGKHPPGPKALPIIGNLHMLGKLPHRTLQALATKYGPIMSLKLGQVPTIVVSSPETAELFLKTHDTDFASRPKIQASEYMFYGGKGLGLAQEELGQLLKSLEKAAASSEVVDLSEMVGELIANITYKMVLGCNKDNSLDLKGLIREAMNLAGAFNLADFLPWLRLFDPQ